jgi:hypothetical protein
MDEPESTPGTSAFVDVEDNIQHNLAEITKVREIAMSIDNFIWARVGVRNDRSIPYRKYKSWKEMIAVEGRSATRHQIFLAHGGYILIDEQYFFESADDARWFWNNGYEERLYLGDEGEFMSFDRMALWIDGKQVDSRGYSATSAADEK